MSARKDSRPKASKPKSPASRGPLTRRGFLTGMAGAAGLLGSGLAGWSPGAEAAEIVPKSQRRRRALALRNRVRAARQEFLVRPPAHPTNADEDLYPTRVGSFTKTLPHDALGEVDPAAYEAYLAALRSTELADFEALPTGAAVPALQVPLVNPQAAYAFALAGADGRALAMPAAPAFASAETAGELVELYWQALLRDVPFADYGSDMQVAAACADLNALSDFRGPIESGPGAVTPNSIFRGPTPGDLAGPYVSQFLLQDVPYGASTIVQQYKVPAAGVHYMQGVPEWLAIQNGDPPAGPVAYEASPAYVFNGAVLNEYVHRDALFQPYLNAALILQRNGYAHDPADPYAAAARSAGFVTFGEVHLLDLVAHVAALALTAAWYQKWLVHRRARPEAVAGAVHMHLSSLASYPLHADVLGSSVLPPIETLNGGTWLLPQAYPEGSPAHPAYPAGHATVAGAGITILKAFFDESAVIPGPVQPSADGSSLQAWAGAPLTVGGELNKLGFNVAMGRNWAGIHWRSDAVESMKLGEQVALSLLRDVRGCYNEPFNGFTLTKLDGTTVTV